MRFHVSRQNLYIAGGVAAWALTTVGAFAVGRRFERERLNDEYNEKMEAEIERTRKHYAIFEEKPDLEELAEPKEEIDPKIQTLLAKYQGGDAGAIDLIEGLQDKAVEVEVTETVVESNVFDSGDDFDYEAEAKNRSPLIPYVITREEFENGEAGFDTESFTYFDGDQTLADEQDKMVDDIEGIVGEDNLTKFGHGSGDPNIVYVRNERRSLDIEIALSEGKYGEEVMGFIEHSHKSGPRRFRVGDDE